MLNTWGVVKQVGFWEVRDIKGNTVATVPLEADARLIAGAVTMRDSLSLIRDELEQWENAERFPTVGLRKIAAQVERGMRSF